MSTNKTQNYQLHSWAPEDEFPRGELNANFTKLDTALKAEATARAGAVAEVAATVPRVVLGTYVGSAEYTDGTTVQTIQLNFRPKIVCTVPWSQEVTVNGRAYGGTIIDGHPACHSNDPAQWIGRITDSGFQVKNVASGAYMNYKDRPYMYWAIG